MPDDGGEGRGEPPLIEAFDWRAPKTWGVSAGFAVGLGVASGATCIASSLFVHRILQIATEPAFFAVLLAAAGHLLGFVALSKVIRARRPGGRLYGADEILKYRIHHEPTHLWRWWRRSWFVLVMLTSWGVILALPTDCDPACLVMVLCLGLATAVIGKEFPIRVLWRTPGGGDPAE
jgi:hypothetical protein